jgi:hypothetical protein
LSARDIAPSVSFFKGVRVGPDGELRFEGAAGPSTVELRMELPAIVLIANAPHPLGPDACSLLEVSAWLEGHTTPEDPLWSSTPELERAYLNTADYAGARGLS